MNLQDFPQFNNNWDNQTRLAWFIGYSQITATQNHPPEHTISGNAKVELQLQEAQDLLASCANQFLMTQDDGTVRHSFMSTEEELCNYLVKAGRLEQIGPGHYRWKVKP